MPERDVLMKNVKAVGNNKSERVLLPIYGSVAKRALRISPIEADRLGVERLERLKKDRNPDRADLQRAQIFRSADRARGICQLFKAVLTPRKRHDTLLFDEPEDELARLARLLSET